MSVNCLEIIKLVFEIIGSVGTFLAALIALFQPYFLNKKKVSISVCETKSNSWREKDGFYEYPKNLKFTITNIGSRKICLKKAKIKVSRKNLISLSMFNSLIEIDVDDEECYTIPLKNVKSILNKSVKKPFKDKYIIFYFYDNSNQIFKLKIKKPISYFINLTDDDLVIKEKIKKYENNLLNEVE